MSDGLSCGFKKRDGMQGTVFNALGAAMVIVLWRGGGLRTRPWAESGRVGTWSVQGNTS